MLRDKNLKVIPVGMTVLVVLFFGEFRWILVFVKYHIFYCIKCSC